MANVGHKVSDLQSAKKPACPGGYGWILGIGWATPILKHIKFKIMRKIHYAKRLVVVNNYYKLLINSNFLPFAQDQ